VGGGARAALVLAATVAVVATGCGDVPRPHSGAGKYPQYVKYQDVAQARARLDALLATLPVYPGAHVVQRRFEGTRYYVGKDYESIDAEPYSLSVSWRVPAGATGTPIMSMFRRGLPARGWTCTFLARVRGELRRFSCARGPRRIRAAINDSGGYVLELVASTAVPPIKQVPQVE
jgi:hypothetical protein